tara:strand:- start:60 stop:848 length:789 start_codon:yes stop_codon:yes gene_type:complete
VTAWLFNLDADQELAHGAGYTTPRRVAAKLRPHAAALAATLPPGDHWLDDGPADGRPGVAWCPTPSALARLRAAGALVPAAPPFAVLQRVNGRAFAHALGALPGERPPGSPEPTAGRWIAHREHTFAGRGHRFMDAPFGAADRAWLAKAPAFLAPRLDLTLEVALHGLLHADGSVQRGVVTVQHVDGTQWRRSTRAPDALEPPEARALHDAFDEVAAALGAAGYFGPFGIDAFRHAAGFHPLSEINARYTMAWPTGMGAWTP